MRRFGEYQGDTVYQIDIGEGALRASVISWGAVLRDLRLHGGRPLVLGFDQLQHYIDHSPHFGATAGRYANRISGGRFALDGQNYQLSCNQHGRHHLHGGERGFGVRPWRVVGRDANSVALELSSENGDQGYPGALRARCVYRIIEPATLSVTLQATCDAPTIVNLAHHSYFTLDGGADVLDHKLRIAAEHYLPVDADLIPTGELRPVAGTAFDFRKERPLAQHVDDERTAYDHNFVLHRTPRSLEQPRFAARLRGPQSGVSMEVWTTEPGLQVYDGAKLSTPVAGLSGERYGACAGVCFEPQKFPDSPNRDHFSDASLRPGESYRQLTEYRFTPGNR